MKYINELLRLKCAPDLLSVKVFPNTKEITESFGMYNAVRTHYPDLLADRNVTYLVVGDGNTPRTAAVFAFRTACGVYSVDPRMKEKHFAVHRLTTLKKRIEDVTRMKAGKTVFLLPHAHVKESSMLHLVNSGDIVITIECCVPYNASIEPRVTYRDANILSPKNEIKIYEY